MTGSGPREARARRTLLGLLLVGNVLNLADRQLLGVALEPIKAEFLLSDTQLGLLSGLAFALFFATLGIPIARLADRGNRRAILVAALGVWSCLTAACGAARSFSQLFAARLGVGAGEAGFSPTAHSLIADLYPPRARNSAIAVFMLGVPAGIFLGNSVGGWVAGKHGWRTAFVALGAPGVLLAMVFALAVREPARGGADGLGAARLAQSTLRSLWGRRSFRYLSLAAALHFMVSYGMALWLVTFFVRSHGMGLAEAGLWVGAVAGAAGSLGTLAGGRIADRLSLRDERWPLWSSALALVAHAPLACGLYLWPGRGGALAFFGLASFVSSLNNAPTFAVAQGLVPVRARATAAATMQFLINLIGLGLGPLTVGFASDRLAPRLGSNSLRYTLACLACVNVLAALLYHQSSRHSRQDARSALEISRESGP